MTDLSQQILLLEDLRVEGIGLRDAADRGEPWDAPDWLTRLLAAVPETERAGLEFLGHPIPLLDGPINPSAMETASTGAEFDNPADRARMEKSIHQERLVLLRAVIDRLKAQLHSKPAKGRKRGIDDEALREKMHELIKSGEAKSAHDAALVVVNDAAGRGTFESKTTRLRKKYIKKYGRYGVMEFSNSP